LVDQPIEAARQAAAHVIVADLEAPALATTDRHHLESVLRVRTGQAISVTDGRGGWRPCTFQTDGGLCSVGDVVRSSRPGPLITVGFAPIKGDRPEWAVQKLTEVGVDCIVILSSVRRVVRWDGERAAKHLERLRTVARQAVMQSRQLWLPEVVGVHPVTELAPKPGVAMAAPGGVSPALTWPTVLVGPEGGWAPEEYEVAGATVSLGPAILRTESAAVVAGVLLTALRAGLVQPA
jgi:16S rRNA (uracil1498-N3)-methyltransferase